MDIKDSIYNFNLKKKKQPKIENYLITNKNKDN